MGLKTLKENKWLKILSNKYILILVLFFIWMIFFDANNYFFHKELNDDIEALEENADFYKVEIKQDKKFIEKMKDSTEMEKFARERYYLKRENEAIYIIENEDSLKNE